MASTGSPSFRLYHSWLHHGQYWLPFLSSLPQLVTSQPVLAPLPFLSATAGYIIASTGSPSFPLCHSWLHYSQYWLHFLSSLPQLVTSQPVLASIPFLSATAGYITASTGFPSFPLCHSWLHHSQYWLPFLSSLPQLSTLQPVLAPLPFLSATAGYITASTGSPSFPLCHSWLHYSQYWLPFLYSLPQLATL